MSSFIHLHTHSHFSLLNGLPKIGDLVRAAASGEMPALALTDNGNLYGAISFYKKCKQYSIKPIIGVDAYVAVRTRFDKEAGIDNRRYRLVLLAKNLEGYKNLLALVTKAHMEGFYYKPRIDRELMEQHCDGLIAILPSFSAETSTLLKQGDAQRAQEAAQWYRGAFGKDNTYLEITHHPEIGDHAKLQDRIAELSEATRIPLVAAHDVYYIQPDDHRTREVLMRIQNNTDITEGDGFGGRAENFSFISQETAAEYFKDRPEALENTASIAEQCDVELNLGSWVFPDFHVASGLSYDEELARQAGAALSASHLKDTPEAKERLDYELAIIREKGFSPYFLVVADLLQFAREHNILTTTRGSAAGSLVSYLTGITNVDPLEYKLPFERFLNPERPSAPDIDMDFADTRRDEVIQYAKDKYGEDKVAQIGTFGTMMARGVVRDVARALNHPYSTGDQIARLIPFGSQGFPMTIDHALKATPELRELYQSRDDVREIIDMGKKIEGNARHISVHAAGVVIAPTPLTDWVPLQFDPKGGKIITQYDMHAVEDAGLLKFDFLGIKNLSILADSVARVQANHGIEIDIENVALNDKGTFNMLARGDTHGLFQLGGSGMTRYVKDLKPTSIHDINAMVALYRPGPMESIPAYIERKHNPERVTYLDNRLQDILDNSYGVITYQDDVLLIAVKLGGYSWLEADTLRKAMGKKIPVEMEAQKEKLIAGFIKNGMDEARAKKMWKLIEPFAAYGFNKSHGASYGKVAYQTAYMKANHPLEYMAAVLTADAGNVEKIAETINECVRLGIPVLPPDVNESFGDFTALPPASVGTQARENATDAGARGEIRFGLYSIKNFGGGIADTIIAEREQNGQFTSLANFLERVQSRNLNRKSLEALIKSGALDAFEDRGKMLHNIENLLTYNREYGKESAQQDSLFSSLADGAAEARLPLEETAASTSPEESLSWEKELLGLYVSGHPLERFRELIEKRAKTTIKQIKSDPREGTTVVIPAIVEEIRHVLTKNGERMGFFKIADLTDSIEAVAFPKMLSQYHELLSPERCILMKARVSRRGGEVSLVCEAVKELRAAAPSAT